MTYRACPQAVPGSLNMAPNPVIDCIFVLFAVFYLLVEHNLITRQKALRRWLRSMSVRSVASARRTVRCSYFSNCFDHEPCCMLADRWLGPAYCLVVSRSISTALAGESYLKCGCKAVTSPAKQSILLAVSLDFLYAQTIGAISRLSFIKPASKSGESYGLGETMWVEPRENGYSKKWNTDLLRLLEH